MRTLLLILAAAGSATVGLPIPAGAAEKWTLQYFYDDPREVLHFSDLAFPTADRGVAVGTVVDEGQRKIERHVALVTSDGGNTWTEIKLQELPRSLFFLDSNNGWLVTDKGVWRTIEAGRQWKRLSRVKDVDRVWFLDEQHGFAVGGDLKLRETKDGGTSWKEIKVKLELQGRVGGRFSHIQFVTPRSGLIVGQAVGDRGLFGTGRRYLVQLQTRDAGATWKASTALAGVTQLEDLELRGGDGLSVFSYDSRSDVFQIDLTTGESRLALRSTKQRITSVAIFADRRFAAGPEIRQGRETMRGFPGKLRVMESTDAMSWTEIPVDYRAEGDWAVLAGADAAHLFLATDQGMILKLE